jgi:hypothetical protein
MRARGIHWIERLEASLLKLVKRIMDKMLRKMELNKILKQINKFQLFMRVGINQMQMS